MFAVIAIGKWRMQKKNTAYCFYLLHAAYTHKKDENIRTSILNEGQYF